MVPPTASSTISGANLVAAALARQNIHTVFGLIGIPVIEIGQACVDIGIRFIAFRNEQSAAYAACAYAYLTGRPAVCLVVGGPGVIHALSGIHHSHMNAWPLVLLAGSSESFQSNVGMGAFQEMDQVSVVKGVGGIKFASRPPSIPQIPFVIEKALRTSLNGRPGPTYIDLPADFILGQTAASDVDWRTPVRPAIRACAKWSEVERAVEVLMSAKRPLVVIGKGAQYARAEGPIERLVTMLGAPFLATPMGKGLLPDTHELSIGAARSSALSHADVVLVLGARLNWILHYGSQPKWAEGVKFVRVDVESEGLDDMVRSEVALCGDLNEVAEQLIGMLEMRGERSGRRWDEWVRTLRNKVEANQDKAAKLAIVAPTPTTSSWTSELSPPDGPPPQRLTYHQAFGLVKAQLPPSHIFIGEGANTLDVGRTVFDVHEPRSRLDPGTQATMGVGMGSAIAAALVAEEQQRDGWKTREGKTLEGRRKVVAVLGDSAFGFSAMEVETAVRNRLGMLIVVMNNGGVYKGLSPTQYANVPLTSLPPTALLPEVRYELLATACGPHGRGYLVRTPDELVHAVKKGLDDQDDGVVTIVNLLMEPGGEKKLEFGWLASTKKKISEKAKL